MGSYTEEWDKGTVQARIRAIADHKCEQCGMEFKVSTNIATTARRADDRPMIGTVHHINGDKQNNAWRNLVFLCQRCHTRVHGYKWEPGGVLPIDWYTEGVPLWIEVRKLPYVRPLMLFNPLDMKLLLDTPFSSDLAILDQRLGDALADVKLTYEEARANITRRYYASFKALQAGGRVCKVCSQVVTDPALITKAEPFICAKHTQTEQEA